jgi:hypothetical protein
MKRVEEICVRHRPAVPVTSSMRDPTAYNMMLLANNIQDINKTLALIYDKMCEKEVPDDLRQLSVSKV